MNNLINLKPLFKYLEKLSILNVFLITIALFSFMTTFAAKPLLFRNLFTNSPSPQSYKSLNSEQSAVPFLYLPLM